MTHFVQERITLTGDLICVPAAAPQPVSSRNAAETLGGLVSWLRQQPSSEQRAQRGVRAGG